MAGWNRKVQFQFLHRSEKRSSHQPLPLERLQHEKNRTITHQPFDSISLQTNLVRWLSKSIHIYVLESILDFNMYRESRQKVFVGQSITGITR